ncbi:MAG TPA: hypothetical protein VK797_22850 [Tepidisphaeraceae bacterium]|nr:hypothetical protein [Tepidisphaeraceae bacterium]
MSLTVSQIDRIKQFHAKLAEVDGFTDEQVIANFKKDLFGVDGEIYVWELIAKAYTEYMAGRPLSLEHKKEAYNLLLARSFYDTNEEALKAFKRKVLTQKQAASVLSHCK